MKRPFLPYRAIRVDKMKGGNGDPGDEVILPKVLEQHGSRASEGSNAFRHSVRLLLQWPICVLVLREDLLFPSASPSAPALLFLLPSWGQGKIGRQTRNAGSGPWPGDVQGCWWCSEAFCWGMSNLRALTAWFWPLSFLVNGSEENRDSSYGF